MNFLLDFHLILSCDLVIFSKSEPGAVPVVLLSAFSVRLDLYKEGVWIGEFVIVLSFDSFWI